MAFFNHSTQRSILDHYKLLRREKVALFNTLKKWSPIELVPFPLVSRLPKRKQGVIYIEQGQVMTPAQICLKQKFGSMYSG